jgi:hypothetical protein
MNKNTPEFITEELLTRLNACKNGKDWWIRNNLEGFPTSRLREIKGDYKKYISWLKDKIYNSTFDKQGNQLTHKDSNGYWWKVTYDSNDRQLAYKDSNDYWWKATYDSNGNKLTHKNSKNKDWIMSFVEKDSFFVVIKNDKEILRIPIDWNKNVRN